MVTFKRNGTNTICVKLTDASYVNRTMMSDSTAYLEFSASEPLDIEAGDYMLLLANTYFVRDAVIPIRDGGRLKYQLTLYGTSNELEKAKYFIFDSTGVDLTADTTYDCTPLEFLQQLVVNMLRIQPGVDWQVGDYLVASSKTLTLANNNCLEMLQQAAQLWEVDYLVDEYHVSLIKTPISLTPLMMRVGKGNGLREITANKSGDSSIVTRLYAYGSDENSPNGQKLTIDPVDAPDALEVVEGIKEFPEIYPRIVREVTAFTSGFIVGCEALGFVVDDYRISGNEPLVTFLSGQCQGLDFRFVQQFDSSWRVLDLIPYELSAGVTVPGTTGYIPAVGDKFVIWNITIPDAFIAAAQTELYNAAVAWLATARKQKIKLNITTEDIYFRTHATTIALGDTLNVTSDIIPQLYAGLSVNVIGYKQFITRSWKYDSLVVGDVYFSRPLANRITTIIINNGFKSGPTGSDKYHRHNQTTASAEWVVHHNMGKNPAVTVTDDNGVERIGVVTYTSLITLKINFAVAITGKAECN